MIKSKLRVVLAERNIRKGEFAKNIGLSASAFSLVVNEKSVPTLSAALRIAKGLELKVEDIWTLED